MQKKRLGTTNEEVSVICLGSMTWGQQNTEKEAHHQLDMALDAGVNFIDTAEIYAVPISKSTQGLSEAYIGSWLQKSGKRKDVLVATKVGGRSDGFPYIRPHIHGGTLRFDRASIVAAVEESLKRLKIETIDLYQLHWPERHTNCFGETFFNPDPQDREPILIEETLGILKSLVDEGKIRYIGLSNETPWGTSEFLRLAREQNLPKVVSIQNPYSLLARAYDVGLAEFSIRENISLLAYSPLAGGALSGKYLTGIPKNSRWDLFPSLTGRYTNDHAHKLVQRYSELAEDLGISVTTLSLAWCIQRPHLTSAIIGATTPAQLAENLAAAQHVLSAQDIERIDQIFRDYPAVMA